MKAEDWIMVNRDRWGFLEDGMMEHMYQNLPIIVWDSRYEKIEYIDQDNWYDWLSDLEGKPYYSHYLSIVLPKEKSK